MVPRRGTGVLVDRCFILRLSGPIEEGWRRDWGGMEEGWTKDGGVTGWRRDARGMEEEDREEREENKNIVLNLRGCGGSKIMSPRVGCSDLCLGTRRSDF